MPLLKNTVLHDKINFISPGFLLTKIVAVQYLVFVSVSVKSIISKMWMYKAHHNFVSLSGQLIKFHILAFTGSGSWVSLFWPLRSPGFVSRHSEVLKGCFVCDFLSSVDGLWCAGSSTAARLSRGCGWPVSWAPCYIYCVLRTFGLRERVSGLTFSGSLQHCTGENGTLKVKRKKL